MIGNLPADRSLFITPWSNLKADMQPTNRDLIIFNAAANEYLERFDPAARPRTKLGYACRRVMKQTDHALSRYNEALEDLRVQHCMTEAGEKEGKRGRILYGVPARPDAPAPYQFDADGLAAFNQAHRALLGEAAEFPGNAFERYFATEVPDDLPLGHFDAMVGFTIGEELAAQIMAEPAPAAATEEAPAA